MALKHYEGTPRPALTAWNCPSCHAANTGPLEGGCVSCKAGGDGVKVGVPAAPPDRPHLDALLAAATRPVRKATQEPWQTACDRWLSTEPEGVYYLSENEAMIRTAFEAGWNARIGAIQGDGIPRTVAQMEAEYRRPRETATARSWQEPTSVAEPAPEIERLILCTLNPDRLGLDQVMPKPLPIEDLTTILAALAFYRENQLSYGTIPGQLSAEGVTALITKLTPAPVADDDIVF